MDSCFFMSITPRVVDSEHSLLLNAYATLARLISRFQLSLKIAWEPCLLHDWAGLPSVFAFMD